jgi:hypothetical protein
MCCCLETGHGRKKKTTTYYKKRLSRSHTAFHQKFIEEAEDENFLGLKYRTEIHYQQHCGAAWLLLPR